MVNACQCGADCCRQERELGSASHPAAAAGADVTVFDFSDKQLEHDRQVARRDGLTLRTVQGDMRDLSTFADGTFDCVFHPVSNLYIPDVNQVWRECHRVLKTGV